MIQCFRAQRLNLPPNVIELYWYHFKGSTHTQQVISWEFFQLVIRDRPFERTITLQKDSSGHVGFNYKNGKITHLLKDSSAARNGLLIDHQICEVGGQSVVGMKVIFIYVFL